MRPRNCWRKARGERTSPCAILRGEATDCAPAALNPVATVDQYFATGHAKRHKVTPFVDRMCDERPHRAGHFERCHRRSRRIALARWTTTKYLSWCARCPGRETLN